MKEGRWLLLIHQLPPKPDYFRVKIWRRLQTLGAVAIKNSVYALPFSAQARGLLWLRKEITAGGGEASVCRATFVDGLSDGQIEDLFRTARDAEYTLLTGAAEKADSVAEVARLERRLREITALDHFDAPGRKTAEAAMTRTKREREQKASRPRRGRPGDSARRACRSRCQRLADQALHRSESAVCVWRKPANRGRGQLRHVRGRLHA
jgi:hypothetical protein